MELLVKNYKDCYTLSQNLSINESMISTVLSVSIRNMKPTRGQVRSSRDDSVLALKWRDKCEVLMLSTHHNSSMVVKSRRSRAAEGGVEDIEKPLVVEDYNQHMGGVDLSELRVF